MIFLNEPCMMLETVEILYRCANHQDYTSSSQRLLMKYGAKYTEEAEKVFKEKMNIMQDIYSKLAPKVHISEENAELFFKKYFFNNMNASVAYGMLLNFGDISKSSILDFATASKNRWKKIMNSDLIIRDMSWSGLIFEKGGNGLLKDRLPQEIDKLPCPVELKWNIQKVLSRFDYYMDSLAELAMPLERELREMLKALDPLIEPLYDKWSNALDKGPFADLINTFPPIKETMEKRKPMICFLRMPCDMVNLDEAWDEDNSLPIGIGITVEADDSTDVSQVRRDMLGETLKIMGEPSRFAILEMLATKSLYGQEIAAKLNIDASTVSRHLNVLHRNNLIYIDGYEGRNTYYRTNQEAIRNIISILQRILLKE